MSENNDKNLKLAHSEITELMELAYTRYTNPEHEEYSADFAAKPEQQWPNFRERYAAKVGV